jgi:hypothetical protein
VRWRQQDHALIVQYTRAAVEELRLALGHMPGDVAGQARRGPRPRPDCQEARTPRPRCRPSSFIRCRPCQSQSSSLLRAAVSHGASCPPGGPKMAAGPHILLTQGPGPAPGSGPCPSGGLMANDQSPMTSRFLAPISEGIWDMKYRLKDPDGTARDLTVEDTLAAGGKGPGLGRGGAVRVGGALLRGPGGFPLPARGAGSWRGPGRGAG